MFVLRLFLVLSFLLPLSASAQFKIDAYQKNDKNVTRKEKKSFSITQFTNGLILRTITDRTSYYDNDVIRVKWELLYPNLPDLDIDYQITNYNLPKLPDMVVDKVLNPTCKDTSNIYTLYVNGKSYRAQTLLCFFLSPLMSNGNFEVGPGNLTLQLYDSKGGFIGTPRKLFSKSVNFQVVNLKNAPTNFSGGIGDFSIETKLQPSCNMFLGQSSTFQVIVRGKGNLKNIDAPKITFPDNFECYPVTKKVDLNYDFNSCSGACYFNYVIIPHNASSYRIGPVKLCYYNSIKRKYETIKSSTTQILVHPKKATDTNSIIKSKQSVISNSHKHKVEVGLPSWIYVLIGVSIVSLLVVYFIYRHLVTERKRSLDPYKESYNLLNKLYESSDIFFVYNQSAKIIKDYVFNTYGEYLSSDNKDSFITSCKICHLSDSLINDLYAFFVESSKFCYSPNSESEKSIDYVLNQSKSLLKRLK